MTRRKSQVPLTLEQSQAISRQSTQEFLKERRIKLANFKNLFHNNTIARELIWDILDFTGFNSVHGQMDNSIFLAEGKRHVGSEIINLLNEIDPLLYPSILLERGKRYGYGINDDNDDNDTAGTDSDD